MTAKALDRKIKALRARSGDIDWDTAMCLTEFHDAVGWIDVGYSSLSDWLADPAVDMTRSTYYRMVGAWREFQSRGFTLRTLRGVSLAKVALGVWALRAGKVTEHELLVDAQRFSWRAMSEAYRPPNKPTTPYERATDRLAAVERALLDSSVPPKKRIELALAQIR